MVFTIFTRRYFSRIWPAVAAALLLICICAQPAAAKPGHWSRADVLAASKSEYPYAIDSDSLGNAAATWSVCTKYSKGGRCQLASLLAATRRAGASRFGAPQTLYENVSQFGYSDVAVGERGYAVAVFSAMVGKSWNALYTRYDGSRFESPRALPDASGYAYVGVGLGPRRQTLIAWEATATNELRYTELTPTGEVGAIGTVAGSKGLNDARLDTNARGGAFVVFTVSGAHESNPTYIASKPAGGSFGLPKKISPHGAYYPPPGMVLTPSDDALIALGEDPDRAHGGWYTRIVRVSPAGSVSQAGAIDRQCPNPSVVNPVLDRKGGLFLAWNCNRGMQFAYLPRGAKSARARQLVSRKGQTDDADLDDGLTTSVSADGAGNLVAWRFDPGGYKPAKARYSVIGRARSNATGPFVIADSDGGESRGTPFAPYRGGAVFLQAANPGTAGIGKVKAFDFSFR